MRVAGATDIAHQGDPVDGLAELAIETRFLTERRGQDARAQLRLEWLAEGVVLRKRKGRDELT
jgi:hypothetical protein